MFNKITLNNITKLNRNIYCCEIITSELLGVKNSKGKKKKYPMWKTRTENRIINLCKDLHLELNNRKKLKKKHSDQLQRKYFLNQKGFVYVMEKIRQRIDRFVPNVPFLYPLGTSENRKIFWCFQGPEKGCIGNEWVKAKRGNLNRYINRINQHQQNRNFRNNEGTVYKKLNGDSNNQNASSASDEYESREFWKRKRGINKVHNKHAERLSNIKSELLDREDITIHKKYLQKIPQKLLIRRFLEKMDYMNTG